MKLKIALQENGRISYSLTTEDLDELTKFVTCEGGDTECFKAALTEVGELLSNDDDGLHEIVFDDNIGDVFEAGDIFSWAAPDDSGRIIIAVATSDGKDGLMCGVAYVYDPEDGKVTDIDEEFEHTNELPFGDETFNYADFFERGVLLSALAADEDVTHFEVDGDQITALEVCGKDLFDDEDEGIKVEYHLTDEK